MKATKPFPSFSMVLPDNIVEEADGAVVSYWKRGDSCLLQISCFRRDSGPQISALQRLNDRVEKSGTWTPFTLPVRVEGCEAAAASTTDNHMRSRLPSLAVADNSCNGFSAGRHLRLRLGMERGLQRSASFDVATGQLLVNQLHSESGKRCRFRIRTRLVWDALPAQPLMFLRYRVFGKPLRAGSCN